MAHILLAIRPAIYECRSAVLIVLHICHPKRIEYWKIWNEMDGFFFCVSFFFFHISQSASPSRYAPPQHPTDATEDNEHTNNQSNSLVKK